MGRFEGRAALVTGAGSGLGRATARRLAGEGAAVAALDIDAEGLAGTVAAVREAGGEVAAYTGDVSDAAQVGEAVGKAAADLGGLQVVVSCAGIGRFSHSHEMPVEMWQRILAVNLTGTFFVCRAAVPHLLAAGGGAIVTVASNAGLMGQPYSAAYCASKGGVVNLTRSLAAEYLERGIRVNCIAPGGMDTPLQEAFMEMPDGVDWKVFRRFMSPLGNASPDEVAGVIAFVASDEARYMAGAIVSVDGGLTI